MTYSQRKTRDTFQIWVKYPRDKIRKASSAWVHKTNECSRSEAMRSKRELLEYYRRVKIVPRREYIDPSDKVVNYHPF